MDEETLSDASRESHARRIRWSPNETPIQRRRRATPKPKPGKLRQEHEWYLRCVAPPTAANCAKCALDLGDHALMQIACEFDAFFHRLFHYELLCSFVDVVLAFQLTGFRHTFWLQAESQLQAQVLLYFCPTCMELDFKGCKKFCNRDTVTKTSSVPTTWWQTSRSRYIHENL